MKNTINLLSLNSANSLSVWEKAYAWTLTIGRYVIIATELIVLVAFFYKFKLDNDLATVKSNIDSDITVFQSSAQETKDIKIYQAKVTAQKFVYTNQKKLSATISHTIGLIPTGTSVQDMTFNNGGIAMDCTVTGTTAAQLTVVQNIANVFKADSLYTNVALNNVQTNTAANTITFDLSMSVGTPTTL